MITSTKNPLVKSLRALQQRHGRDETGEYLIDGVRLVAEAFRAGAAVERIIVAEPVASPRVQALVDTAAAEGVPVVTVAPHVLEAISQVDTPQGIAAVLCRPTPPGSEVLDRPDLLLLVADQIQDPGNLGTMIRTADAAGAIAVALTEGSADLYNPKTVRSTMGSLFHLPVLQWPAARLSEALSHRGVLVVAADPSATQDFRAVAYSPPVALVIGNEAAGLSAEWRSAAAEFVRIPLYGRAESLNAAVAAGVLLYEARRAVAPIPLS